MSRLTSACGTDGYKQICIELCVLNAVAMFEMTGVPHSPHAACVIDDVTDNDAIRFPSTRRLNTIDLLSSQPIVVCCCGRLHP